MYSLLLVDDEETARSSIKAFTPWAEYGFEEPMEASNGLEALECIEEKLPDVIITDIKMPYMDGMELIRKVREEYSSTTQIVIISGYDEFTFAQEAVQLKVSEYVLKPVSVNSMKTLLEKIRKRIEDDRERFSLLDKTPAYQEAFSLYKERFLISLITQRSKKVDDSQLESKAKIFDLPIECGQFAVATMESQEVLSYPTAIEEISKEVFQEVQTKPIIFQYENQLVLLFSSTMNESFTPLFKRQIYRNLTILKESLSHYFGYQYHIGVGEAVHSLKDISRSYDGAIEALNYSISRNNIYIIDVQDIKSVEQEIEERSFGELKSELVFAIKYGTKEDVKKAVHNCFSNIAKRGDIQSTVLFILGNISEIWNLYSTSFSDLLEEEDLFMELAHIKTLSSGEKFCTLLAMKANEKASGTREISRIEFVENAKRIIRKRYTEPLFGLDSLCDEISVSPAYFSTTFKKETGISFVQFLTNTRIEKAKELLKNSEEKTYEIAEKVGFSEPNYFSFTFKKNVGLSPSQYRIKEKR